MHDTIIRRGTIVDGTGGPPFEGDVAIDSGRISVVGQVDGSAREEIDAGGRVVTPGFIDIHTHYDGQVSWDPVFSPSPLHGVTTAIMGNCGVGFAPVHPGQRSWAIGLMEGVEDIPSTALTAGIRWEWETFPEFLAFLDEQPLAIDVGTHIPHGPLRAYVMGQRGIENEPASAEDIETMAHLVGEAIQAGALGFSTSRLLAHKGSDGVVVPGTFASEEELFAVGRALGRGVFEVAPAGAAGMSFGEPLEAFENDLRWMRRLAAETGRSVVFALIDAAVIDAAIMGTGGWPPAHWRYLFNQSVEAWEEGVPLRAMTGPRPPGGVFTLGSKHAFVSLASYQALATLPLPEQVARMRERATREAILSEARSIPESFMRRGLDQLFTLGDPPNYDPAPENSIEARAIREGRDPLDVYYDALLQDDGREVLIPKANSDPYHFMLAHPCCVLGLGDGGAHVTSVCDMSSPTVMLTLGIPDASGSSVFSLEWAIWKQTGDPASLYGLNDRGVLQTGKKADLNLIDLDRLRLRRPEVVYDLPGGGASRLIQRADGYVATMVSGVFVARDGQYTGARPGTVARGC